MLTYVFEVAAWSAEGAVRVCLFVGNALPHTCTYTAGWPYGSLYASVRPRVLFVKMHFIGSYLFGGSRIDLITC